MVINLNINPRLPPPPPASPDSIPREPVAGGLWWHRRPGSLLHGPPVFPGQGPLRCPRLRSLPHSFHSWPILQTRSVHTDASYLVVFSSSHCSCETEKWRGWWNHCRGYRVCSHSGQEIGSRCGDKRLFPGGDKWLFFPSVLQLKLFMLIPAFVKVTCDPRMMHHKLYFLFSFFLCSRSESGWSGRSAEEVCWRSELKQFLFSFA